MDVGDPSNFARMNDLFFGDHAAFQGKMSGYHYTDQETKAAINQLHNDRGYIADPHGAIGYLALKEYMITHDVNGVFLETAHPVKFREEVEPVIKSEVPLPSSLENTMKKKVMASECGAGYREFHAHLSNLLRS